MFTKVTRELMDAAYNAGYDAAKNDKLRAPASSAEYMLLIRGFKVGEGANQLADEFIAGFDYCIDENLANEFADDEYFTNKIVANKQSREAKRKFKAME